MEKLIDTAAWAAEELQKIASADDLMASPLREDGKTYGTTTWIWNVVFEAKEATMKILPICIMQLILLIGSLMLSSFNKSSAQDSQHVVRMAKIQVDSTRLNDYKAILAEEIETAVRVEPGVLTLYAIYEKDHPTHITILEIYANQAAYEAHLKTAHFRKYKEGTQGMVKALELVDVAPIALMSK